MPGQVPHRTNKLHRSRIDWQTIKHGDFDRAVEALILRIHANSELHPFAINGKGGDDGIDAAAAHPDGSIEIVYQLKYFPEGFSGAHGKSRKPQVKKSFDTALEKQRPQRWVLIMPPNPQIGERNYVNALAENNNVSVEIWGRAQLDEHFAKYPDLEQAITRNDTVDYLSAFNAESAALAGPEDLPRRAEKLLEIHNTESIYWKADGLTLENGEVRVQYSQKRPDAMEHEPMRTYLGLSFGADQDDLRQQVQQILDFGSFAGVALPADNAKFWVEKPAWAHYRAPILEENESLELHSGMSKTFDPPLPFVFHLKDDFGYTKGNFSGSIDARTGGRKGSQLRWVLSPILSGTVLMEFGDIKAGRLTYNFSPREAKLETFTEAVTFMKQVHKGAVMEFYIEGRRLTTIQLNSSDSAAPFEHNEFTNAMMDDLRVIQNSFPDCAFVVPMNVVPWQRRWLRAARYLLEGHRVPLPPLGPTTFTLEDPSREFIERFLTEPGQLIAPVFHLPFEWERTKVDLGTGYVHFPEFEVVNREDLERCLENMPEKITLTIRVTGDDPANAWLSDDSERKEIPALKQWEIPG